MVDSASCAVSALTEGLWSASLLLNPVKQPYTKPKSSFIPRKGALFPATALVKRWQSHHWDVCFLYVLAHARFWIYHWTSMLHSRYANVLVSGARHNSQTSESSRDMDLHRPSNITESLLTERYPLSCSWGGVSHGFFPVLSYWRLPAWYPDSLTHPTNCLYSRRDSLPPLGNHSQSCVSHGSASAFLAFAFRIEANHWISLANSWCSSSFCPSLF